MKRCFWILALIGLSCTAWPALAQVPPADSLPPGRPAWDWGTQASPSLAAILAQDPFSPGKDAEESADGNGKKAKEGPQHIRDNAFLVEEAFNQEKGEVQHIINWITQWNRIPGARTRDFAWLYTMELPLGGQKHQFAFTTSFESAFEHPDDGPAIHQGGVGDTLLSYRYQFLADDDFLWCAPNFILILPTGDERFGLGTGQLGYQFNLPISRYGELFDFHFNAGFVYIPNVSVALADGGKSPGQALRGYNLGASVFWKPRTDLHFFVELLALRNEELDEAAFRDGVHEVFANPGFRYAIIQEEVEWVVGLAAPIGLTGEAPDIGLFVYMSVEHGFRKSTNSGGAE